MGLAATSATKLLLTAEISNIELEVQQIQRQKLNLSNLASEIEDQALQMPVPTAPSTYDFMKDVYTGTDGNGNPVVASMGADGLYVSRLEKKVPSLEAKQTDVEVKQFEAEEAPAKKPNTIHARRKSVVPHEGFANGQQWIDKDAHDKLSSDVTQKLNTYNGLPAGKADGTDAEKEQYRKKEAAKTTYETAKADFDKFKATTKYELGPDEDVKVTDGQAPADKYTEKIGYPGSETTIKYDCECYNSVFDDISAADVAKLSEGYSEEQITEMVNAKKYYTSDAPNASLLSASDFENGKLNVSLFTKLEDEQIGSGKCYTFDEITSKPEYQNASSDMKNKVNDLMERARTYASKDGTQPDMSNWRIVANNGGFSVVLINPQEGKATTFAETTAESGYKTVKVTDNGINAVTGAGTVTLEDGSTVAMIKTKKIDEDAYEAAQSEYNREKAEYDRAQEAYNQETKRLQRIDKNFDLKLTRLENERAALTKEIESLDKVTEDNIEGTFSAFS